MNKAQYLNYLIKEYNLPDNTDLYSLYGFFQADNLDLNGQKYLNRLIEVFEPNNKDIADDELIALGKEYLFRLSELSKIIQNDKLSEYINSIEKVEIGIKEKYEIATEGYSILYHVILDWIIDQIDFEHPVRVLDEAYYSIACDPWLANYLKWPQFNDKQFVDVFEPYFHLWKKGINCYFNEKKLILGSN